MRVCRILACLASVCLAGAPAADERPNVIIINVDNHEKGELGYYGNRFIETPALDRLFRDGLRFENYHISGRCTSSRAALMTGRYHARTGAMGTGGAWGSTREGLTTLGHVFTAAGYRTALFGKWHMGDAYPLRPEDRGFEEVVTIHNGSTLGHVVVKPGYNKSPRTAAAFRFRHNGAWQVYEGFRTDIWFNELRRYLAGTRKDERPFFAYLATVTAHGPHYGPKDLQAKYRKKMEGSEWGDLRRQAKSGKGKTKPYDHAADIEGLDRNVGRLLETLEELKLSRNTVFIYMSDGAGGGTASVSKKAWPAESQASGTPFVIRRPGAPPGARAELVANIDLLPTLAEICGVPLKPELLQSIDGRSFASLVGIPNPAPWEPRGYIADHQSSGGKDDLKGDAGKMMLLRPLANCTVFLPDGAQVSWKSQKPHAKLDPEVVKRARAAYETWLKHVLEDFPLGAFCRVDAAGPHTYLDAYPIPDGPAGEGLGYYFLLDVAADGPCELSTDTSERYGAPPGEAKSSAPATLLLSRQTKPGRLPVGFDEKHNGYRVLPATLKDCFETTSQDLSLPATLTLAQGRYLISVQGKGKKPVTKLKVTLKDSSR
jgi:arylsulfatase A-like enzyme